MKWINLSACTDTNQIFTKSGFFEFMQLQTYESARSCIITMVGRTYSSASVYILYGCESFAAGGSTNFNDGAVFYGGNIYRFIGGSVLNPTGGNVFLLNLSTTQYTLYNVAGDADPMDFTDGIARNILDINEAQINTGVSGNGSLSNTIYSDYSNLVPIPFGRDSGYTTVPVSTGSGFGTVTGNIHYRKNWMNNTLTIYGSLTTNTPGDFNDLPTTLYYDAGITLPIGYRPILSSQYFTAYYFTAGAIFNFSNQQYINSFRCAVNSAGKLLVNWIKPDVAITGYVINISVTISLD